MHHRRLGIKKFSSVALLSSGVCCNAELVFLYEHSVKGQRTTWLKQLDTTWTVKVRDRWICERRFEKPNPETFLV